MTNENCLEGIKCPDCGNADRLKIVARVMCLVTDDGSDPYGDHEWDDDSFAICPECDRDGRLAEFREGYTQAPPSIVQPSVEATPRPWAVWRLAPDSDLDQRHIITTTDGEQEITGIVHRLADAERIVRCVNAHDALVSALQDAEQEIKDLLEDLCDEPEEDIAANRTLEVIRTVLSHLEAA